MDTATQGQTTGDRMAVIAQAIDYLESADPPDVARVLARTDIPAHHKANPVGLAQILRRTDPSRWHMVTSSHWSSQIILKARDHDPANVLTLVKDVEVHSRQLVYITLEPSTALYVHAHGHTIQPDKLHLAYVRINGAWSCDVWTIMGPRSDALVPRRVSADIHSLEGATPGWVTTLITEHTPTLTEA